MLHIYSLEFSDCYRFSPSPKWAAKMIFSHENAVTHFSEAFFSLCLCICVVWHSVCPVKANVVRTLGGLLNLLISLRNVSISSLLTSSSKAIFINWKLKKNIVKKYHRTCLMKLGKCYQQHTSFIISLAQNLQNYVSSPCCKRPVVFNSLRPRDTIWRHRSRSTLDQVMACCLTAPSHYLNQCWLIISKV